MEEPTVKLRERKDHKMKMEDCNDVNVAMKVRNNFGELMKRLLKLANQM